MTIEQLRQAAVICRARCDWNDQPDGSKIVTHLAECQVASWVKAVGSTGRINTEEMRAAMETIE